MQVNGFTQARASMYYIALIQILFIFLLPLNEAVNWAQLAGKKEQNVVEPYDPDDGLSPKRPMWSARWGHSTVVLNQTSMHRNDLTAEENSNRSMHLITTLFLLGGDDYLQYKDEFSNGGFRNDVWYSEVSSRSATTWSVRHQFLAINEKQMGLKSDKVVTSNMKWLCMNEGKKAPPFWPVEHDKVGKPIAYDDWISCQDYFGEKRGRECFDKNSIEYMYKTENMWSPRRGHASAVLNGNLYVIGGRSRERVIIDYERFVGAASNRIDLNTGQRTIRESTVLKNDVWMSKDAGKTWTLVTPGCRNQQEDILIETEFMPGKTRYSTTSNGFENFSSVKCQDSTDCYGDEVCKSLDGRSDKKVCVCPLFGIREHHSLDVQHRYVERDDGTIYSEDYLYLTGGFTQVRHEFCGNLACGNRGSYRMALDDVWVSNDGANWVQLRRATVGSPTSFKPRGGHSTNLISANSFQEEDVDRLFVFGGESVGPNQPKSEFLADMWYMELFSEPCCVRHTSCHLSSHPLTPYDLDICISRRREWIRMDLKSEIYGRAGHVSIHEPPSSMNAFKDYIYIIGGKNSTSIHSDVWSLDLTSGISWHSDISSHTSKNGDEIEFSRINSDHDYNLYYDMESNLTSLVSLRLPSTKSMDETFAVPLVFKVIEDGDVAILEELGIKTFSDLINADQRTILHLRGHVKNICYVKQLIEKFNSKCFVGEMRFKTPDISDLCQDSIDPDSCILNTWDGCRPINDYTQIDIPFIHGSSVSVPAVKLNHTNDLQNMHCKYTPGPRYMASGQYAGGKVLILGGQGNNPNKLYRDVWYRDDSHPTTIIKKKPKSKSSSATFVFESNEDGALQFEYKIFDQTERLDVTPWITCLKDELIDVSWLDSKKGGPGSGWYTMYVRSGETQLLLMGVVQHHLCYISSN